MHTPPPHPHPHPPRACPIIITTLRPINTRTIGILSQPLDISVTVRPTNEIHLGHRMPLHHLNGDGTWCIAIERNHTDTICRAVAKKKRHNCVYLLLASHYEPTSNPFHNSMPRGDGHAAASIPFAHSRRGVVCRFLRAYMGNGAPIAHAPRP